MITFTSMHGVTTISEYVFCGIQPLSLNFKPDLTPYTAVHVPRHYRFVVARPLYDSFISRVRRAEIR